MLKPTIVAVLLLSVSPAILAKPVHITRFDTNHSTILFRVPILGGMSEVVGKFTDFTVDLVYDDAAPAQSTVVATIKSASIDTGIPDRDKDLRTANFFDCQKYPEIRFESTSVEKSGDGFRAMGRLTMHGVSKPIVMPIRITGFQRIDDKKSSLYAFEATAKLNRQDYGVSWKHPIDPAFVGDEVSIEIHLLTKLIPDSPAPAPSP